MNNASKIELLAPAGSYDAFRAGLSAGADAFYLGGSRFGARAYAENFTEEVLLKTIDEAHVFGKRVFLTINTLFKERELEELYDYLLPFYKQGLDAVIVQDLGALKLIREAFPEMHIHASTQMTVTGANGAKMLEDIGVKRVVPARELSAEEIKLISDSTSLEIECFVHGALCYCYSGQCLMSSFIGGRSGNRGRCAQPCRMPYSVYKGGRLISDENRAYALNTKDMCLINNIKELADAGITSFKIEGRMKRPEYTAGVVSVYRKYLDMVCEKDKAIKASGADRDLLADLFNRDGFNRSYFFQHNGQDMMALKNTKQSEPRMKKADEAYEKVRKETIEKDIKKKVKGIFTVSEDLDAELIISDGTVTASVDFGEVQRSQNRPLTVEMVTKQLNKTGGTEFEFESLDIQLPGDAFMTVKDLNGLRRSGFESFREKLLESFRRKGNGENSCRTQHKASDCTEQTQDKLFVSVLTRGQYDAAAGLEGVDGFYIPLELFLNEFSRQEQQELKGRVCIALSYISRYPRNAAYADKMLELAGDGFDILVRSLEDAAVLVKSGYADRIRLDYNVYTMNSKSREFIGDLKISKDTVPLELNQKELRGRDNSESEFVVYGRVPVMLSAQCLRKSYDKCDGSYGSFTLKDRKGARFPVFFECGQCYNVIFNSVPISLLSIMDKVKETGAKQFRIMLTVEDEKTSQRIVREAVSAARGGGKCEEDFDFTRGHFNRGVE